MALCIIIQYTCIMIIVLKAVGTALLMTTLLLQAIAAVQTSLIMKSGDIELNPGPGLYPGIPFLCHNISCINSPKISIISDLDYENVDSNTILS